MAEADDVRRLARALPNVAEIKSEGFDFRVADRGFVWSYPERRPGRPRLIRTDIAVLFVGDEAEKQALLLGEPDVFFTKDGEDYIIQMNDEDVPQLRLNAQYRKMLDRENGATKEVRDYVRERYTSAIQLMKNIEQRKQTILKVCQAIVRRQTEFLSHGLDYLKPMMIKEVAEEVGVHPSTVSRAVASKYVHTPQGVFELRYFFSEAVQGPLGGGTPLLLLKRKVKKMIEEEDRSKPLTDEQITAMLQNEGINVTRRTVAKYREDMKIPSTHQRRVRN